MVGIRSDEAINGASVGNFGQLLGNSNREKAQKTEKEKNEDFRKSLENKGFFRSWKRVEKGRKIIFCNSYPRCRGFKSPPRYEVKNP